MADVLVAQSKGTFKKMVDYVVYAMNQGDSYQRIKDVNLSWVTFYIVSFIFFWYADGYLIL